MNQGLTRVGGACPWHLPAVLVLLLLVCVPAQGALRCGNRLVSEGERKIDVLAKCGDPTLVEERVVYRSLRRSLTPGGEVQDKLVVPVTLEEWTYNFGPLRFMQMVRFAGGEVVEIVNLGYGY